MSNVAKTSSKEVKSKKKTREATAEQRKAWRLDLVREPLIDKALEENGLDRTGLVAEKAERLDSHFRNTIPAERRLDCEFDPEKETGCGFTGPDTSVACPFCGLTDVDERDADDLAKNRAGSEAAPIEAVPAAKAAAKAAAKPESKVAEPKASKPAKAPKPAAIVQARPELLAAEPADEERLAELDAAVQHVAEVHARGVANFWDLGRALMPIHDRQLYLQRKNDDGSSRYRGWSQFLAGEFGGQIAAGHSYRMMDVARKFDRETAIHIGVAKLSLLVRAKPEALPRLLKAAESQSVKELAVAARPDLIEAGARETGRDERPGAGGRGRTGGSASARKEGTAMASKRAEARSEDAITVATTLGTTKIPLFVKGAPQKRARKISDDPCGEEVFVNGVRALYSLVIGADGGYELHIVRRRVKS